MRILLLEDEYALRMSIEEFLEDLGYQVDAFMDGSDAHDAVYDTSYDLLLLDVNVPSMDGFELLKNLKESRRMVPTIYLTAKANLEDLKKGYECGCCDYIRKPFDLEELELRIHQICKIVYSDNNDVIHFGCNTVYDMAKNKLMVDNDEVVLRKTESDILRVLIKHKNAVVSINELQDEVWGEYVEPATIRVQLKNLRQKLPGDIIKNRRGLGYIIEQQ